MVVRFFVFLIIAILSIYPSFCQTIIKGKLLKTPGDTPIAYANIGILNSPIGTISNEDGSFEIRIPEQYVNDTLLFSALGLERKSFPITEYLDKTDITIHLTEQATLLQDVVVTSEKNSIRKTADFGNQHWDIGSIYVDSIAAGSAMALLIENKYPFYNPEIAPPYYITKAKLRIAKNTVDEFKIRVRFYAYDSVTGLPGKDVFNESVVITSSIRKGWLNIDLSKYYIRINAPSFFIAFEWILNDEDRITMLNQYKEFKRLYPDKVSVNTVVVDGEKIKYNSWQGFMAGTSFGSSSSRHARENYKSYYRNNSYGAWKRASFVLATRVTVSNQPAPSRKMH